MFLRKYLDKLDEFRLIPKFQNERAISALIALYIEKIVSGKAWRGI
jgi:hypothetical protein